MNTLPGNKLTLTRRGWTALVAVSPLIAQVSTAPQSTLPLSAPAAATPEQRTAKTIADVRKVIDRLAQTEVPMSLEPAFTFRA